MRLKLAVPVPAREMLEAELRMREATIEHEAEEGAAMWAVVVQVGLQHGGSRAPPDASLHASLDLMTVWDQCLAPCQGPWVLLAQLPPHSMNP